MERLLVLEDGTIFEGQAFGANLEATGELVLTTVMSGYQETITDPVYTGQIIAFTYPMIGAYGITRDHESILPTCKGVVVHEWVEHPSSVGKPLTLDQFLKARQIPGISGIDTRALSRIVAEKGVMKATLINKGDEISHILSQLQATVLPSTPVQQVSTKVPYAAPGVGRSVVLIDLGLKHSILRELSKRACDVIVVPYTTTAEDILSFQPDGVLLSGGPGNPQQLPEILETIQCLQERVPFFAIGLGHQLLALANGAEITPSKQGHMGMHAGVRELATGRVEMAYHQHRFSVRRSTLPKELLVTFEGDNDHSVEGLRHRHYPAFSVQFSPEAGPGPRDFSTVFDEFMEAMDAFHHLIEKH